MTIAKTIINQIQSIDNWAFGTWGAKNLVAMPDGLKFQSSGMTAWKGHVYIQYDEGQDLYNIIFGKIRKSVWKEQNRIEGVFCDQLVELIDRQVG